MREAIYGRHVAFALTREKFKGDSLDAAAAWFTAADIYCILLA
jgi:hypothetical protein